MEARVDLTPMKFELPRFETRRSSKTGAPPSSPTSSDGLCSGTLRAFRAVLAVAALTAAAAQARADALTDYHDALTDHRYENDHDRPATLPFAMTLPVAPRFPDRDFNLLDYGGNGDGRTMNRSAFASAINACAAAGGGRVVVPPGRWLTGAIELKSNVNLYLEKGSTVVFSTDPKDYLPAVWVRWAGFECWNYSPLIYARDCENIAITGRGAVDGQGERWWYWVKKQAENANRLYKMTIDNVPVAQRVFATPQDCMRPQLIQPINCKNVLVEGITIQSGPFWTLQFVYCNQVIARNLTIQTSGPNNDGIDLDSCRDALIEGCDIASADDCLCLKSGINEEGRRLHRTTERVVIRHCVVRAGRGGFVVGSDTSGDIRNVLCYDCDFLGTDVGIRLKSARGRGGVVENIWCRDIRMHNIGEDGITITTFYTAWFGSPTGMAPIFRNITLENIKIDHALRGITIYGLPEQPIENVVLRNLHVGGYKGGLECRDARNLTFDHVFIDPYGTNVAMTFKNTHDVVVKNCVSPEGCDTYLVAQGAPTGGIRLEGDDLTRAQTPFRLEGASAGAVKIQSSEK